MTRHPHPDAALDRLLDGLVEEVAAAPDDDMRAVLAAPEGRRALRAARDAIAEALACDGIVGAGPPPGEASTGRRDPLERPHR